MMFLLGSKTEFRKVFVLEVAMNMIQSRFAERDWKGFLDINITFT